MRDVCGIDKGAVHLLTLPLPPAHSEEWHEMRSDYLGASDVAALFGASPFKTIGQLAEEKRTGVRVEETRPMHLGTHFEDAIAEWWSAEQGVAVALPTVAYGRGRLLANPDRLIVGSTTDHLEVKFTRKALSRPERHWWMQAQAQMACMGTVRCHFAVLDAKDCKSWVVDRDDSFIEQIDQAVEKFWAYLDDGLDPPTSGSWPVHEVVDLTAEQAELVEAWRTATRVSNDAKADLHDIRGELERALGISGLPAGVSVTFGVNGEALCRVSMRNGPAKTDHRRLRLEWPDAYKATLDHGNPFVVLEAIK